jgi:hypothetical protein
LGITWHQLEKYAIENYYTVEALKSVFGRQIPDSFTSIAPNKKLEEQLVIEYIITEKSLERLKNVDLLSDLKHMLQKVNDKEYLKQNNALEVVEAAVTSIDEHAMLSLLCEIANKLEEIKDKHYQKDEFLDALERLLGHEDAERYQKLIIECTQRSMDVKGGNNPYRIAIKMTLTDIQHTEDLYDKFLAVVEGRLKTPRDFQS